METLNEINFGIVQGRLSTPPDNSLQWFPETCWEKEFSIANQLKYDFIELIVEENHNKNNPIWSSSGRKRIIELTKNNNLCTPTMCNCFLLENSLIKSSGVIDQALELIRCSHEIGVSKMVLPLFEQSEMNKNNYEMYIEPIITIANYAEEHKVSICLETILNGKTFLNFFDSLKHPNVYCVFDTGNMIAENHDIYSDILLLKNKINYVHIKDKNQTNENVLLGTGLVNFKKVLEAFKLIGFKGLFTFETVRGSDPIRTAKYNKAFLTFFFNEVYGTLKT